METHREYFVCLPHTLFTYEYVNLLALNYIGFAYRSEQKYIHTICLRAYVLTFTK